jgi:hypothetical protein
MQGGGKKSRLSEAALLRALFFSGLFILIIDIFFVAYFLGFISLPIVDYGLPSLKSAGEEVLRHYEKMAESYDLKENREVLKLLGRFREEIKSTQAMKDVTQIISMAINGLSKTIAEEREETARDEIIGIIEAEVLRRGGSIEEPKPVLEAELSVSVDKSATGHINVRITDRKGILSPSARKSIESLPSILNLTAPLELKISGNTISVISPATAYSKFLLLGREREKLRSDLAEVRRISGQDIMTGPGIIVEAYDMPNGYASDEIVHDQDIRDIANLLFDSGATGMEIGGQRIVLGSSIRCAGPVILVNHRPISVNPIIIKVAGDPDALSGSLAGIMREFEVAGKRLEIRRMKRVVLSAYVSR